MESPEELEKALARLMPSAISDSGQRAMEETLDRLAAGEPLPEMRIAPTPATRPVWYWWGAAGAAAASVVGVLWMSPGAPAANSPVPLVASAVPETKADAGLVLVGQTEVVEEAVPEDWISESDGVAHRAWRVRVLDRERLRDVRTGYEVTVTRPREEVRLMPVNSF